MKFVKILLAAFVAAIIIWAPAAPVEAARRTASRPLDNSAYFMREMASSVSSLEGARGIAYGAPLAQVDAALMQEGIWTKSASGRRVQYERILGDGEEVEERLTLVASASGNVDRYEMAFMTDSRKTAERLCNLAVVELTRRFGNMKGDKFERSVFQDKDQLKYVLNSGSWESAGHNVLLSFSYRNPDLVKGPDGKPYKNYLVSISRWR